MKKWLMAFTLVLGSTMAHADGEKLSVPANQKWKTECGSCHIAYPPQLLTAGNWQNLMAELDKHFDANAILDANDNKEILDFLQRYAGHGARYSASSLRITDTPWFTREHRKVPFDTWSDPAVKSRSNCTACHINAERGDWSESGIKMPGGKRAEESEGRPGSGSNRRSEEYDRD